MEYSIWIVPPEPVFNDLQKVIEDLSQKYKSPLFSPHMTVLGTVEAELEQIEEKLRIVTKKTKPLSLSLGPVSFSTTFFQSVFVRVNSTAALMELNLNIKNILKKENNVFMPHISLLYGDHDMETREKIISEITLPSQSFVGNELSIVAAPENIDDWKQVAKIPLG